MWWRITDEYVKDGESNNLNRNPTGVRKLEQNQMRNINKLKSENYI